MSEHSENLPVLSAEALEIISMRQRVLHAANRLRLLELQRISIAPTVKPTTPPKIAAATKIDL